MFLFKDALSLLSFIGLLLLGLLLLFDLGTLLFIALAFYLIYHIHYNTYSLRL